MANIQKRLSFQVSFRWKWAISKKKLEIVYNFKINKLIKWVSKILTGRNSDFKRKHAPQIKKFRDYWTITENTYILA